MGQSEFDFWRLRSAYKFKMPATRRKSLAPEINPPPSLPSSSRPASRRASTATFVAPVNSKVTKKAPAKPVRKNVAKAVETIVEAQKENSFVAGDMFDFSGMELLSPRGPMTRSRRTSVYVPPSKGGLVTSTVRKSVTKKPRTSNLDSVMETPKAEESYTQPEQNNVSKPQPVLKIVESPEGEISFKTESLSGMTPQMIEQHTKLLAKKDIIKNSSVIISPIKKLVKPRALPTKPVAKPLAEPVEKPIEKPVTKPAEKPVSKPATKPVAKLAPKSPKKKASSLPLPKLTIPKKIASVQKENVPGTPQQADPGNLLKRNLKRKVDTRMDKKIDEIPKNSSPYTLLMGETENGSPVEHFVKISKPTKTNVTGTPGPALKMKQKRVLQPLKAQNNQNNIQQEEEKYQPHRKSPRLLATPKKLNLSNAPIDNTNTKTEIEPTMTTPKLETENQAVNKVLAKQKTMDNAARSSNATANSGGQMITGDLASMCVIM